MIVCPNCKHENPEGASSCEACYTNLPATKACPTCGASVQIDATFCGQCGQNLFSTTKSAPILLPPPTAEPAVETTVSPTPASPSVGLPPTVLTNPEVIVTPSIDPDPVVEPAAVEIDPIPDLEEIAPLVNLEIGGQEIGELPEILPLSVASLAQQPVPSSVEPVAEIPATPLGEPTETIIATQLQARSTWQLLHIQTQKIVDVPNNLEVICIGKPNDRATPDIDVSGFPSAEVVSRVHANIRIEGDNYYIEDVGSANGTYINHNALSKGNRHLLRAGDRIGLGKGDLVTFIFQSAVS
jgi:ribosomal protein L40E